MGATLNVKTTLIYISSLSSFQSQKLCQIRLGKQNMRKCKDVYFTQNIQKLYMSYVCLKILYFEIRVGTSP